PPRSPSGSGAAGPTPAAPEARLDGAAPPHVGTMDSSRGVTDTSRLVTRRDTRARGSPLLTHIVHSQCKGRARRPEIMKISPEATDLRPVPRCWGRILRAVGKLG